MSSIYGLLIVTMICTGICYTVAMKRQANVPYWVVMGALCGPFAVPFVFFSKPRQL